MRGGRGSKSTPLTQMYLDVGQRNFHSTRCGICGMLYTPGDAADERLHATFHASATKGLRYISARGDKVLATDGTRGQVVLVRVPEGNGKPRRVSRQLTRAHDCLTWDLLRRAVLTHRRRRHVGAAL